MLIRLLQLVICIMLCRLFYFNQIRVPLIPDLRTVVLKLLVKLILITSRYNLLFPIKTIRIVYCSWGHPVSINQYYNRQ